MDNYRIKECTPIRCTETSNPRLLEFSVLLKKEIAVASNSPYDEWLKSLINLRDEFDSLFGDE
mgnify:CR=1 FL=1